MVRRILLLLAVLFVLAGGVTMTTVRAWSCGTGCDSLPVPVPVVTLPCAALPDGCGEEPPPGCGLGPCPTAPPGCWCETLTPSPSETVPVSPTPTGPTGTPTSPSGTPTLPPPPVTSPPVETTTPPPGSSTTPVSTPTGPGGSPSYSGPAHRSSSPGVPGSAQCGPSECLAETGASGSGLMLGIGLVALVTGAGLVGLAAGYRRRH